MAVSYTNPETYYSTVTVTDVNGELISHTVVPHTTVVVMYDLRLNDYEMVWYKNGVRTMCNLSVTEAPYITVTGEV